MDRDRHDLAVVDGAGATGKLTLTARWYLAHANNATAADSFRLVVVSGTTRTVVVEKLGRPAVLAAGKWNTATIDLSAFAGRNVRFVVETVDAGADSLLEAGLDDLKITQT